MQENLAKFGFFEPSSPYIGYENGGSYATGLINNNKIYKAAVSYGYGVDVNLYQLMQAYSVFNNDGISVQPRAILNKKIYEE
ncbi:MAG: hypothetical protein IE909_08600 [Campylobacterales bacterium]|nr:hypothetical protein [Campylobacterales bacterium]